MPPRRKAAAKASKPPSPEPEPASPVPLPASSSLSALPSLEPTPHASPSASPLPIHPQPTFSALRAAFRSATHELVESLRERRKGGSLEPVEEGEMEGIVEGLLDRVGRGEEGEEGWRRDVRRGIYEKGLEAALFDVAMGLTEVGDYTPASYALLADLLDVILTFSDRDYTDANLPLICIGPLLDLQTIEGCHHIFAYIESRVERLTKNMHPTKGKGPLLLRFLNELLRRLPKSNTEHVIFSGRILMFLSSVFPLGEKSGVNLRGNFNITKGTVFEEKEDGMVVDEGPQSEDFYTTFWSLQRFFTDPSLLFTPGASDPFKSLQHGLTKTLEAFAEATTKEKELLGAGKEGGKVKAIEEEEVMEHYFFPKFLTSRNLLELELADAAFRRQILVQALVLFQYLLGFSPSSRSKSIALPMTNAPALPPHTLSSTNETWINDLRTKTLAEMQAMIGGPRFRQTVELILSREQNWINWKLRSCLPFETPPLPIEASEKARNKLGYQTRKIKPFPYKMGNPTLSKLWERDLTSLEAFEPAKTLEESFDRLVRDWKMTERIIKQRLSALATNPALSDEIERLEIKAKALHWRAIRVASTEHLHLFASIGAGDLDELVRVREEERREAEKTPEEREEERRVKEEERVERERVKKEEEEERVKEEEKVEKKVEDVEMGTVERERAKTPPLREKEPSTPKRPRGQEEDPEREVKKLKNSD